MISVVTVGNTSTLIVPENRARLRKRLYLVNNSNEVMSIAPGEVAVATQGIILVASGGSFSDEADPSGYIYQGPYTAICTSGGKLIAVTELNRDDQ